MALNGRVLLLNFSYEPLGTVGVARAMCLVLRNAVIVEEQDGARRIYRIDPEGLGQLRRWLDGFWDDALDNFKAEAEKGTKKK